MAYIVSYLYDLLSMIPTYVYVMYVGTLGSEKRYLSVAVLCIM